MKEFTGVVEQETMDKEWMLLVAEAREIGLSVEEVRSFLGTYTKVGAE